MILAKKLKCVVCGRVFYEGQGVILNIAGKDIVLHSKSCALKFVKSLLEKIESSHLAPAVKETLKEFEEALKRHVEATKKKI